MKTISKRNKYEFRDPLFSDMAKRVILVTGTPCVGKTKAAIELAKRLDAEYVNLTELAKKYKLVQGEDKKRHTIIIDENGMQARLDRIIEVTSKNEIVIDGHFAAAVAPRDKVTHVLVLRRNPIQLRDFMMKCGYKSHKLWENLASEILDVCLVEALHKQEERKVCELDVTSRTVQEEVEDILSVISGHKKCRAGGIDWLGMLEAEGVLEEYLNI